MLHWRRRVVGEKTIGPTSAPTAQSEKSAERATAEEKAAESTAGQTETILFPGPNWTTWTSPAYFFHTINLTAPDFIISPPLPHLRPTFVY